MSNIKLNPHKSKQILKKKKKTLKNFVYHTTGSDFYTNSLLWKLVI